MLKTDDAFGLLIGAAAALWIGGWLLLALDAVTGFRFIERYPAVGNSLGALNRYVWIAIAVLFVLYIVARTFGS